MVDLPPMFDHPTMQCVRSASNEFSIPQLALMSVLKVEAGTPGKKKRNQGVSKKYEYDLGRSQFNQSNLEVLDRYGIKNPEYHILHNDCYNIRVGAWWLKREIVRCKGDLWCGVGNYHTGPNVKTQRQRARNNHYQHLVYNASLYITSHYNWK